MLANLLHLDIAALYAFLRLFHIINRKRTKYARASGDKPSHDVASIMAHLEDVDIRLGCDRNHDRCRLGHGGKGLGEHRAMRGFSF